jgi:threonine dehydrogenase-like Zn-dependent dehydrogenase
MRALVYEGPWTVSLRQHPGPRAPAGGEVVVRVRATGICGTDLGIISGGYPASRPVVLGHESAGEVVAVGPGVGSLRVGSRVAIDPTFYCGFCRMCRTGRQNHCEQKAHTETGVSRDGTFAPLYLTEERFLYELDDHVGFEEATLTEPLSCVLTGVQQLSLRPALRTLVLGGGPIGLLYACVLALHGISGGLVELSEPRRALGAGVLEGWWLAPSLDEAAARGGDEGGGFDLIVDTTGQLAEPALGLLARGGQLLLVGLRHGRASFDPGVIADRSLRIVGSIDSLGTFADACRLIANGSIPARRLVTHAFPLERFGEALQLLGCDVARRCLEPSARALKAVILPSEQAPPPAYA